MIPLLTLIATAMIWLIICPGKLWCDIVTAVLWFAVGFAFVFAVM